MLPLRDEREPRLVWEWLLGVVVCLACAGWVAWRLHVLNITFHPFGISSLVLRDTTANGGDMGAHVYWPWFLEHNWFLHFRLAGWSPDWYSGFPIGQYYFPFPAVLTSVLDLILPYNVAFKIVTVLGPILLPVAAYHLSEQLELPWPASPLWAVGALYYEFELRTHAGQNTWTIYGGNLASSLAGEFSFSLALTLSLFFLAALAYTLRTGNRPWLAAVLLAAAVTSHIVVAVFAAFAGLLVWLLYRPGRTWRIALPVGVVAFCLSALWVVPLLATNAYTSSMRYEKLPLSDSANGSWLFGFSWWIWVLLAASLLGAGFWRRRAVLLPLTWAVVFGLAFWLWPQDLAIWNTRFIPFYFLAIMLLAAMGAVELVRLAGYLVAAATAWVAEGDRLDRVDAYYAAHPLPEIVDDALAPSSPSLPAANGQSTVESSSDVPIEADGAAADGADEGDRPDDSSAELPGHLARPTGREMRRRRAFAMAITIAILTAAIGSYAGWRADEQGGAIASGWSSWNYSGYEAKTTWPEYQQVIHDVGTLPCGRLLWEPSSGDPDGINSYGTSLALELLPYWTRGCIGSQEGLYFEASATKDAHFLTVSELAQHPSNPVRGLQYGTTADFNRGVQHAQMLGVRYLMFWTPESEHLADTSPDLRPVLTVPDPQLWAAHFASTATAAERAVAAPGWKVYEIRDWSLAEGLTVQPVVAKIHAGTESTCFGVPPSGLDTKLNAWECATDPWWMNDAALAQPFAEAGPADWRRVDANKVATVAHQTIANPAKVTRLHETVRSITFHVDQVGKPVVVKTSFFPNWKLSGARGPYRLAPNLMVVIPTSHDVRLDYGVTGAEWLGRVMLLIGLVLLVLLIVRFRVRPEWTAQPSAPGPRGHGVEETEEPVTATATSLDDLIPTSVRADSVVVADTELVGVPDTPSNGLTDSATNGAPPPVASEERDDPAVP